MSRAGAGSTTTGQRILPKAELHCHIEGTASPRLVARQAARYGADVSGIIADGRYVWHDFSGFLAAYDIAASIFRTPEDYALLAKDYLAGIAADGAIYSEIFVSPDHARSAGLDPADYLDGLAAAILEAEAASGIICRMIVIGVRHFGAASVEDAARFAAGSRHPFVTGFGMAGDERAGRPAEFARAFDIARDAGLGLTAHAGELGGPDGIAETLDRLKPSRLGHGVRAMEDRDLVRRIAAEGIVLEVCPGSNMALGLYPEPRAHPLRALQSAGCRVTLGSDDPPFFGTSLAAEYAFAAEHHRFSEGELLGLTRNALDAAFVDPETRGRLHDRLMLSALALGAPGASD